MRIIPGRMLAPIGWFGLEPLDPQRFQPPRLSPLELQGVGTKPLGGLWCSPIKRSGFPPKPIGTSWTLHEGGTGLPFTEVVPDPDARIAVVSTRAELAEIVQQWPDTRDDGLPGDLVFTPFTPYKVDWAAMAAQLDAFYATSAVFAGVDTLNLPLRKPHLWGWDVPTVLFLQPAFTAGRVHEPQQPRKVGAHRWI